MKSRVGPCAGANRAQHLPALPHRDDERTAAGTSATPPRALAEAMDRIESATGLPVAHIVYREVCTGWVGSDVEQNSSR